MIDDKNKTADKAFKAEQDAADACRAHLKSCYICRFRVVSFFIRCLTLEGLIFSHMAAKTDADRHRPAKGLVPEPEAVPEAPTVEWLENFYKL